MTDQRPEPVVQWSDDIAKRLREPFKPEQIGKLPKIPKSQQGNDKKACTYCGGWHEPIIDRLHVDFVGHAVVTDRLNNVVGPGGWSWELNQIQEHNGHITGIVGTMTVAGRTIGPESGAPSSTGLWGEEFKTAVSDYIPRAAMRFGVALELWAKQKLESATQAPADDLDDAPATGETGTPVRNAQESGQGPSARGRQRGSAPAPVRAARNGTDAQAPTQSEPAVPDRTRPGSSTSGAGSNGDESSAALDLIRSAIANRSHDEVRKILNNHKARLPDDMPVDQAIAARGLAMAQWATRALEHAGQPQEQAS